MYLCIDIDIHMETDMDIDIRKFQKHVLLHVRISVRVLMLALMLIVIRKLTLAFLCLVQLLSPIKPRAP